MAPVQIFISYARLDDEPPPGLADSKGFVTYLHNDLRHELRELGQPRPDLWRDVRQIEPAHQFDPALRKAIDESAILLVVLSRNWSHRPYCLQELERFAGRWSAEGDEGIKRRLVVVSKHFIHPEERPRLLQGQQGFEFFTFDGEEEAGQEREFFYRGRVRDEARYEAQVTKLAKYLWQTADRMSAARAVPVFRTPHGDEARPQSTGRTVYLAKPATDAREAYFRLAQELQRRGYSVVPAVDSSIPLDSSAVAFVDEALAAAELSIHLLGDSAGFQPENAAPIVDLQLARAAARVPAASQKADERSFRRLIWAPKMWNADAGTGASERDPLAILAKFDRHIPNDTVEGDSLSRFVDSLVQHLDRTAPPIIVPDTIKSDARVYLYHRLEDSAYVLDLAKALKQRQVKLVVAALDGDPAEVSAEHRKNLAECNAVVLCWAAASEVWARATARELRNWRELGRTERFACRGLVAGPPPGQRKVMFVELADDEEIDVVVDLTGFERPPPAKLDELVRRVRPDAP